MRILCLAKRSPQGRDLITRPYGRFFYLPWHLAQQGHDVTLLLLGYRNEPPAAVEYDGLRLYAESALPWGPGSYLRHARRLIKQQKPDWIIGFSDTWYGILAQALGAHYRVRVLIDAYDNYESYIPWLKPLHWQWRRALRQADILTAAGPNLAAYMTQSRTNSAHVIPMSADPIFAPLDKNECRQALSLPADKKLLGYCGGIAANRGIHILFEAFARLKKYLPDLVLVLSGRVSRHLRLPADSLQLGYLPDAQMPLLLNSLDTLAVLNLPSAFGNFSYPVKLYEAMRCQVPVVVSRTPASEWILAKHPDFLVPPLDVEAFAAQVRRSLESGRCQYAGQSDWQSGGERLGELLHGTP